jgi:hypothetical protein
LTTTSGSSINITSQSGLGSALSFSGSNATVGDLTVNTASGSSTSLGSSLTVAGALSLQSGSLVLNNKNLTIGGTIATSGSGSISSTSGSDITVNTSGNSNGSLAFTAGSNTVKNFTINVGGGSGSYIGLGSNLTVSGKLNFTQGSVYTGSNTLAVASADSITEADSTSYVMTDAGGYLHLAVAAGGSSYTRFHVGTTTAYSPVGVQLNSASASGGVNVGVVAGVMSQGTTGTMLSSTQSVVANTYFVEPDNTTSTNANIQLNWSAAAQVNGFDDASAYISHYTGGAWDTYPGAAATLTGSLYSSTRTNISSFSPFAVFDKNTTTGINTVAANNMLEIYPNPTANKLTIQTGTTDKTNVQISDMSGQVVGSYELSGGNNTIGVESLSTGNYFIKVVNAQTNTVKKFTKI